MKRTILKLSKKSSTLQIGSIKIKASHPKAQPFNEYIFESKKDIMYFYYDLTIKCQGFDSKWRVLAHTYVTEYGILLQLADALREVLDFDVKKKGTRDYLLRKNKDGETVVSKTEYCANRHFTFNGMLDEDCLEITKKIKVWKEKKEFKESESYDVNFFISWGEPSSAPIGTRFTNLSREEVEDIIAFADHFIEIAVAKTKKEVEKTLSDDSDDEYNYPKKVRDYLKEKYGIDDWRPIFLKLSTDEYVLEEFVEYITGQLSVSDLKCREKRNGGKSMEELFKTMDDYKAYLHIIDDSETS